MAYTTPASNTAHLWSYFQKIPLEVVEATRVWADLGDDQPLPQKHGIQMIWTKIKKLPSVTASTTPGTVVTPRAITSAQITAAVSQYKDAVGLTDYWLGTNANAGIEKALREIVSEQLQRSVDLICRNALDSAINTTQYGGGVAALSSVGPTNAKLTLPVAQLAKATLEANDVAPIKGGYYAFVGHVNTIYDMKTDTATGGWQDVHKYTDNAQKMFNAEAGMVDQIKFLKTTLVSSTNSGTSGSAYAYTNMIFGFQPFGTVKLDGFSYGLQWHAPGDSGVADPNDELATLGWKIYFACQYFGNQSTVSDPDRAIKVITGRAS